MDTTILSSREVFNSGDLSIIVEVMRDSRATPPDSSDDSVIAAWKQGTWRYVGIAALVVFRDVQIGLDAGWSIKDGNLGNDVTADAWDMAGPLPGIVQGALSAATEWLKAAGAGNLGALLNAAADQWAGQESAERPAVGTFDPAAQSHCWSTQGALNHPFTPAPGPASHYCNECGGTTAGVQHVSARVRGAEGAISS